MAFWYNARMERKWRYLPHLVGLTALGLMTGVGCDQDEPRTLRSNATPTYVPAVIVDADSNAISTPTPDVDATAIARNQLSIGATVEATSPEELEALLDAIPNNLRRSAVSIYFGDANGTFNSGSGVIVDYDSTTGIAYGLTASHVVPDEVTSLHLYQPHKNDLTIAVELQNLGISYVRPDGLCVFAFRADNSFRLGTLGEENVLTDWSPEIGDEVFGLGFPTMIRSDTNEIVQASIFPAVQTVVDIGVSSLTGDSMVTTDGLSSPGGSGEIIVDENGQAVGYRITIYEDVANLSDFYTFNGDMYSEAVRRAIAALEN